MKKDLLNSPSDNYISLQAATELSNTTANASSLSGPDATNYDRAPFLNGAVYNNGSRQQVLQSVQPPYNQTIAKKLLADQKLAYLWALVRPQAQLGPPAVSVLVEIKLLQQCHAGAFLLRQPRRGGQHHDVSGSPTITNLLGTVIETRTIQSTQNQNIDFNLHTPPGAYIIQVTTGPNTCRQKIEVW